MKYSTVPKYCLFATLSCGNLYAFKGFLINVLKKIFVYVCMTNDIPLQAFVYKINTHYKFRCYS
jgi:hypothetical protein